MRRYHETFRLWEYLLFALVTLAVLCLCVCVGSVRIPLADTLAYFAAKLTGGEAPVREHPSVCRVFCAWR